MDIDITEAPRELSCEAGRPCDSEGKVIREISHNPLKPYLSRHGLYLDFTPFEGLGSDFMVRVAEKTGELINLYATRNSCLPPQWYSMRRVLAWLSQNLDQLFPDVAAKLKENGKPTEKEWQAVINTFRGQFLAPSHLNVITTQANTAKGTELNSIRSFQNHMAIHGILPRVTVRTISKVEKFCHPKRGLAERPRAVTVPDEVEQLICRFINKDTGGTSVIKQQKEDYIRTLWSERQTYGDSGQDILQAITALNNKRIVDVRSAMEEELTKSYDLFQKGQKLLDLCDVNYEDEILPALTEYLHTDRNKRERGLNLKFQALFGPQVDRETLLSRLLTLIVGRWDGMVPNTQNWELQLFVQQRAQRAKIKIHELRQLLGATGEALIAAAVIILIDTGKNASDIEKLPFDCLTATDDPGIRTLMSRKVRSGNEEHDTPLRVNDGHKVSAIKAIEMVRSMTERLRAVAAGEGTSAWRRPVLPVKGDGVEDKLFVYRCKKRDVICAGFPVDALSILRQICDRYDSLKGIPVTFDSIRPSVALKRFMDGDLDAGIAQSDLRHANKKPTGGYVMRFVSKIALEREIRSFQDQFQAVMIADIPQAAVKLGFSPDEFENLLNTALRNGLGCVCLRNILGKNKSEPSSARSCNIIEECNTCKHMRIFVTSKPNLVDAILLDRHLEKNHEEMAGMNPDRFRDVWMPTWARVRATVQLAQTTSSVSRVLLSEAQAMADQIGTSVFPPMF